MAKFNFRVSVKHLQIDKANTMVMVSVAATVAIVIFSLIATRALWTQRSYQSKVIGLRSKANKQLEANLKSTSNLVTAYQTFEDSPESAIGTPEKNSKIVLDALPSKYDFPALATSLESVIIGSGGKISSITGTDNEAQATQDSVNPQPIEMPFEINSSGSAAAAQTLILNLERSIRPIKVSTLDFSVSDSDMQVTISAKTYYQPSKKLDIQQKTVTFGKTTVKTSKAATK